MRLIFSSAKWIGAERLLAKKTNYLSPAVRLRKCFVFNKKQGKRYICRICGLGCYVLYLNGKRIGDDVLSPAFTAYDKRALYVEYDVTEFLVDGENVVAIKLGDGFYNQTVENVWDFHTATWRDAPKTLFEIISSEGEIICESNLEWRVSTDGATIHNAIRTGEYYDARKEDAWIELDYDDSSWALAFPSKPVGGKLNKMKLPFIRECKQISAVSVRKTSKGFLFDFGENIAGYISFCLSGKAGQTVEFHYGEKLKNDELYCVNSNLKGEIEYSVDKYTFKGQGIESWKPEFVYHGFQYVEVVGLEYEPPMSALTAYFVHTDLPKKGSFSSSDDLLQWLYDAGVRSFLSNVHGFIEDCPHREKNGWTGDAVVSCDYSVYLFEMKETYKKWLRDMVDAQRENGQLPGIVPTAGWGYNWGSGPAWDAALFFLPYAIYKETGDKQCLYLVYSAMKKYLEYARYYRQDGLVCFGLSDWAFIDAENSLYARMSNELSDSCYYYQMQAICAEVAQMRGEIAVAEKYRQEAEETRLEILRKYVKEDSVDNGEQGALAIVLYFNIVYGKQAENIASKLVEKIKTDKYIFKVGILGMKALLNALSMYGYTDIAYKMVNRYEYPSYGDWKQQGATTFWEYFNGGASRNHHMYTDVVNWMIRNVAGLQNYGIAYEKVVLKPYFYAVNCECKTETITSQGLISFEWKKSGDLFEANITLPKNRKATLILPNQEPIEVENKENKIAIQLQ